MKFLIIADPFENLLPATDSGLLLLVEALRRGHQCYWALADDLYINHSELMFNAMEVKSCSAKSLPKPQDLAEVKQIRADTLDGIWIRKDPPFDLSYLNLCWMLSLVENRVPMINSPRHLITYHEKNSIFQAKAMGFLKNSDIHPTWLGFKASIIQSFSGLSDFPAKNHEEQAWITKPWLGYGGRGVEKWPQLDQAKNQWQILTAGGPQTATLLQPYATSVATAGDRRVFFVNGKMQFHFVRIPKAGSHLSNLAQGGSAKLMPLSAKEEELIPRIEGFLQATGIVLAGVDLLAGCVSEINITAPTGFAKAKELGGPDLAVEMVNIAEAQRKSLEP